MEVGFEAPPGISVPDCDNTQPFQPETAAVTAVFSVLSHDLHAGCVITPVFRGVVEYDSVPVIVVDGEGFFIYCNASAEALMGYDAATLTSRTIFEIVNAEATWVASEFGHLSQHETWSGRVLLHRGQGGLVRVAVNAFAHRIRGAASEYIAMLHGTDRDEPAIVRLESQAGSPNLTPRDISILQLLAEGFADKELAAILNASVWTINKDVGNVLRKLQVSSRTEACIVAVRRQMIT